MDEDLKARNEAEYRHTHPPHRFQILAGEDLDEHLMAMHGWQDWMVQMRGALTHAQLKYHYASDWHRMSHRHELRKNSL